MSATNTPFLYGAAAIIGWVVVTTSSQPINDLCENAIEVSVGETVVGLTADATPDVDPFCSEIYISDPGQSFGLWYFVAGTCFCGENFRRTPWLPINNLF